MSAFGEQLARLSGSGSPDRRWVFVPYDQLTDEIGPLSRLEPGEAGIILIECPAKAARRPYHKRKLALVLANLRHFALEQARRGAAVRHVVSEGAYADALRPILREVGEVTMMRPAERELREDLAELHREGGLDWERHEGWLTDEDDFASSQPDSPPWKMDAFYRHVRRRTGILMDDGGKPVGGRLSFDGDNRKPWKGDPPAPELPTFPANDVKDEVVRLVESRYADHPGRLDPDTLPSTREDAESLWSWAMESCLPDFGPYEDAMSRTEPGLFHTRASELLHLHRLLPRRVLEDALALDVPIASKEGFVRQVIGWREFVRHVHERTDGFRSVMPRRRAERPLPDAFWSADSGLACLDTVVRSVWDTGYGHHITRLMILANLATLLDCDPEAVSEWFWVAYADAYDWVVEPNVLAMGTYATPVMTTKPYVCGANYISRMSDYCGECAFDPKRDCPITSLYWRYLERHAEELSDNPRIAMPYRSLAKRDPARREEDLRVGDAVVERLERGDTLDPESLKELR